MLYIAECQPYSLLVTFCSCWPNLLTQFNISRTHLQGHCSCASGHVVSVQPSTKAKTTDLYLTCMTIHYGIQRPKHGSSHLTAHPDCIKKQLPKQHLSKQCEHKVGDLSWLHLYKLNMNSLVDNRTCPRAMHTARESHAMSASQKAA